MLKLCLYRVVLLFFCWVLVGGVFGQDRHGVLLYIKDSLTHESLSNVTVKIKSNQGKVFIADAEGIVRIFNMNIKDLSLQLSRVGYETKEIDLVYKSSYIDTIKVFLKVRVFQQQSVVIEGVKRVLELKPDMVVYNIGRDSGALRKPLLESLNNLPFLTYVNGVIKYYDGARPVIFLLNGKRNAFLRQNPVEFMRSLVGSQIERIEIWEPPPQRYELEGGAAVVNIVSKNMALLRASLSGQFTIGNLSKAVGLSLGGSFRKFDYSVSYSGTESTIDQSSKSFAESESGIVSVVSFDTLRSESVGSRFTGEFGYSIDSVTQFSFSSSIRKSDQPGISRGLFSVSGVLGYNNSFVSSPLDGLDFSAGVVRSRRDKKGEVTASFFFGSSNGERIIKNDYIDSLINRSGITRFTSYGSSLTASRNFSKDINVEYLGKVYSRRYEFDNLGEKIVFGVVFSDSILSNNSTIDQIILQNKFRIVKRWKRFSLRSAVMLEYFDNRLSDAKKDNVGTGYFNVLPEVGFTAVLKNNRSVSMSFRVDALRPNSSMLNPFVDEVGILNVKSGNVLNTQQRSYSAQIEYRQVRKYFSYSWEIYASLVPNNIGNIFEYVDSLTRVVNTYTVNKAYYGTMSFRFGYSKIKNLRLNASIGVGISTISASSRFSVPYFNSNISLNYFNQKLKLNVGTLFYLNGRRVIQDGYFRGTQLNDYYLSKVLVKKWLIGTVTATDPFGLNRLGKSYTKNSDFIYVSDVVRRVKGYSVTLIVNLSKNSVSRRAIRSSGANEDLIR